MAQNLFMSRMSETLCSGTAPYRFDRSEALAALSSDLLLKILKQMVLIRNFETRAEAAYQHGKVGGFLHVYSGQEAIACAGVEAIGQDNWWIATYRCHAMALLLGATPNEVMAELYGRETGNAGGRGGSMHLYTDRLLGGFGIVGGQIPVAMGAAFSAKYRGVDEVAVCFLGDGAVAQGAFHEALNLASLWDLPAIVVIENNQWGMGTNVHRAISVERIAEAKGPSFGIEGYTCDGMDFIASYHMFNYLNCRVRDRGRPVLVEMVTERFRGHSISDPAFYRTKDQLSEIMQRDPIQILFHDLEMRGMIDQAGLKELDKEARQTVVEAMEFAENSPWPDPALLEEDVFAP